MGVRHDLSAENLETAREEITEKFPDYDQDPRTRILLYRDYVEMFLEGGKETTVRFEEGKVDVPGRLQVPLVVSFPGSDEEIPVGKVQFTDVEVKRFGDLTDEDAERDGFGSAEELKEALLEIYEDIPDRHPVTIYGIETAEPEGVVREAFLERVE